MKINQFIFLLIALLSFSCAKPKKQNQQNQIPLVYLTNDSIKFWESYPPIQNTYQGYYFSKNGTCDEFQIDKNKNRFFYSYDDIKFKKPFRFKLIKDTLKMFTSDGDLFYCFRVLKINKSSLVLQQTDCLKYNSRKTEIYTTINKFQPSKDQQTKPENAIE